MSTPTESRMVLSGDGTRIWYDFYDAVSAHLAVVVPGFWRDRKYPSMRAFAGQLGELGHAVAVVDVRGHGDSEGLYGFNRSEHHDVAAVVTDLLQKREFRDILLVGMSVGGAIAITTAARHDFPWRRLLLISPVAKFSMIRPGFHPLTMHRHLAVSQALKKPRFDWRFVRSPKVSALDEIGNVHVPVDFVHVKNDWLIHHRHSERLFERANEPKSLNLIDIPGNWHADRIFRACPDEFAPILARCARVGDSAHTPD